MKIPEIPDITQEIWETAPLPTPSPPAPLALSHIIWGEDVCRADL